MLSYNPLLTTSVIPPVTKQHKQNYCNALCFVLLFLVCVWLNQFTLLDPLVSPPPLIHPVYNALLTISLTPPAYKQGRQHDCNILLLNVLCFVAVGVCVIKNPFTLPG